MNAATGNIIATIKNPTARSLNRTLTSKETQNYLDYTFGEAAEAAWLRLL